MVTPTATRITSSRERILKSAEALILDRGFAGTTIDDILDKAAITKGGFFYHFNGKMELARALVERYIEHDTLMFKTMSDRADELSEDPLQSTLVFLKLLGEMVAGMTEVHPGCLVTAFVYEIHHFDQAVRQRIEDGILAWRHMMEKRLQKIVVKYPPRIDITIESLADMFISVLEGGIILARIHQSNQALVDQVNSYRDHLRLLFSDVSQ